MDGWNTTFLLGFGLFWRVDHHPEGFIEDPCLKSVGKFHIAQDSKAIPGSLNSTQFFGTQNWTSPELYGLPEGCIYKGREKWEP